MKPYRSRPVKERVIDFKLRKLAVAATLAVALVVPTMLPTAAMAQGRGDHDRRHDDGQHRGSDRNDRRERHDWRRAQDFSDRRRDDRGAHRQSTKNNWRNLGILGGAVGVAGLLTHNSTLAALGVGGGLYSLSRYEADRKSQSRDGRDRYELFRHESFDHNGHHYVRRERSQNGQRFYYFQRQR